MALRSPFSVTMVDTLAATTHLSVPLCTAAGYQLLPSEGMSELDPTMVTLSVTENDHNFASSFFHTLEGHKKSPVQLVLSPAS